MSKPLYSICLICKDEEKVLPRLLDSLKEFRERGGEICAVDTGSTDNSTKILRQYGCIVEEVGQKYLLSVSDIGGINKMFVVEGEQAVVKYGDKYFNFSAARNHSSSLATNDFVFFYDCDEVSVVMDIDTINKHIEDGMTQAEYQFVFGYDGFGNEAIKFVQCKAYDRRIMEWKGVVHELVSDKGTGESKRVYLDESIYKLAHHQNQESGRHIYLTGLVQDCFNDPKNDRHVHYTSRELLWSGRPKSALKLFKQHTQMGGWAAERAESFLFMGDIQGQLGRPDEQVRMYNEAFYLDSGRNKALMQLAFFYRHNKNYQAAICYAKAALEIKYLGFYADNLAFYRELPHEVLYQCYGYIGNIEAAKEHILKALEYQPLNPQYLSDTKYYFEYADKGIEGWMKFDELQFLYNTSKKMTSVIEVGSWCGRSSHAILSGCKGDVTCIDSWEGSDDVRDYTNTLAKQRDIFSIFKSNVGHFEKLKIIKSRSVEAAELVPDKSAEMVFIDAGHDFDSVVADIRAWKSKATKILCGHDFLETWMGVIAAVRQELGEPDEVHGTIWVKYLS